MENTNQKKITKNRDQINNLLGKNIPLDILYFNIRKLAKQNKKLIKENIKKN